MRSLLPILLTLVLTACGGGGGGSDSSDKSVAPALAAQVTTYQNANTSAQVFNTQVADLNGDGLEDVVVSGWAVEYTAGVHGRVPVKILIQQADGSLQDRTDALLGSGNNMIWGSQRVVIADFDNDTRPDIFLGGFQDGNCCTNVNSVMLWNNGTSFARVDLTDSVWAHAVCTGDLNNDGLLDIVSSGYIYTNTGHRSFNIASTGAHAMGWGDCAIVKDTATGNTGIVSTNINYVVPGYTGIIQIYDSNMNWLSVAGLPGSEGATHDIVNIVPMDLNNDGIRDLVLTDNMSDNHDGKFTALINNGSFAFGDSTATYFPTQANNYYFQYYTRVLTVDGMKSLFVDMADGSWNFNTLPQLWSFVSNFQTYLQTQLSSIISNYKNPTVYRLGNGKISLLLIKSNGNNTWTFYNKSV